MKAFQRLRLIPKQELQARKPVPKSSPKRFRSQNIKHRCSLLTSGAGEAAVTSFGLFHLSNGPLWTVDCAEFPSPHHAPRGNATEPSARRSVITSTSSLVRLPRHRTPFLLCFILCKHHMCSVKSVSVAGCAAGVSLGIGTAERNTDQRSGTDMASSRPPSRRASSIVQFCPCALKVDLIKAYGCQSASTAAPP